MKGTVSASKSLWILRSELEDLPLSEMSSMSAAHPGPWPNRIILEAFDNLCKSAKLIRGEGYEKTSLNVIIPKVSQDFSTELRPRAFLINLQCKRRR